MDVLLLGAAAIVLIGLTVWIVWRPGRPDEALDEGAEATATQLPPQGDTFEDQYTSATADLSAAGVALAEAALELKGAPTPTNSEAQAPTWSRSTLAREVSRTTPTDVTPSEVNRQEKRTISIGAAILFAAAGAVGGAWLYARWQRQRASTPVSRLRRRIR